MESWLVVTLEKLLGLLAKYPPNLPVLFDIDHELQCWPSEVRDYRPHGGVHLVPGSRPAACAGVAEMLRAWRPGDETKPAMPVWADATDDLEPAQAIIGWERTPTALVLRRASISDYV